MKMYKILLLILFIPMFLPAQSRWKRSKTTTVTPVHLFHSSKSANLPTAETIGKGDFMFEISHRFGRISDGYDALWGFDGPVKMRIALSYGITPKLTATLARSNLLDNVELAFKQRVWDKKYESCSMALALVAGAATNSEPAYDLKAFSAEHTQFFGQLVLNGMFWQNSLGIGFVPSYVYNSYIFADRKNVDKKYTFTLGTHIQYYFNRIYSIWGEFSPVLSGWQGNIYWSAKKENRSYNPIAFGVAIETGGHIFDVFVTNSTRLNTTQYLIGAESETDKDAWKFAFGITREL